MVLTTFCCGGGSMWNQSQSQQLLELSLQEQNEHEKIFPVNEAMKEKSGKYEKDVLSINGQNDCRKRMLPLQEAPSPPTSGPKQCGIGCNINTNEYGELFITKVSSRVSQHSSHRAQVIPGGPAAFSCNIAVDDVILCVDGVSVAGETVDDVKRRIVGPEGIPIEVTLKHKRHSGDVKEHVVRLLRQPAVPFPERLSEGPIGLGLDLERVDDGALLVRKLQNGGAAALSNHIRVGDKIVLVDGIRMNEVGPAVRAIGVGCQP
eukprot:754007-Hanusia_phi.AAC.3